MTSISFGTRLMLLVGMVACLEAFRVSSPPRGLRVTGFTFPRRSGQGGSGLRRVEIAGLRMSGEEGVDEQQKEAFERLRKRIEAEAKAKEESAAFEAERAKREKAERDAQAKEQEMQGLGDGGGGEEGGLDMSALKERVEMLETKDRQWGEIKDMLEVYQVRLGVQLLDGTGEPGFNAWVLIAVPFPVSRRLPVEGLLAPRPWPPDVDGGCSQLSVAVPIYVAWSLSQALASLV